MNWNASSIKPSENYEFARVFNQTVLSAHRSVGNEPECFGIMILLNLYAPLYSALSLSISSQRAILFQIYILDQNCQTEFLSTDLVLYSMDKQLKCIFVNIVANYQLWSCQSSEIVRTRWFELGGPFLWSLPWNWNHTDSKTDFSTHIDQTEFLSTQCRSVYPE